jgi:hypothetical protein
MIRALIVDDETPARDTRRRLAVGHRRRGRDGLSEATSPDGREPGVDGLIAILRWHAALPARQIVEAALADVREFCAGAAQATTGPCS